MRGLEVDAGDLAEQHLGVLLAAEHLAGRRRDLALGEDAGRHLVEQRLEEVVRGLGDHRHVDVGAAQRLGAEQPPEARTRSPRPGDAAECPAPTACLPCRTFPAAVDRAVPADPRCIAFSCRTPPVDQSGPTSESDRRRSPSVHGVRRRSARPRFGAAGPRVDAAGQTSPRCPDRPWETTVPLNRPALSLGPGPRGVQNARRWVVDVCTDIGRADLAECAELGVSELVTNALLHAETPITRAGARHPGAPPRRGPRRLAGAAAAAPTATTTTRTTCCSPSGAAWRSWPAAADRLGRRDRGRRQGRLVRARPPEPAEELRRRRDHRPRRARAAPAAPATGRRDRAARRPAARLLRLPDATTASCAARSGCWRWRTRPTTRWPRPSPTSSARWTASSRGHRRLPDRRGRCAAGRKRTDLRVAIAAETARPPSAGSSSCSTSPTRSAASSGCSRWPASPSSASSSAGSSASSSGSRPASPRWRGTMPAWPAHAAACREPRSPRRGCSPRWRSVARSGPLARWALGEPCPDGTGFPWTTFAINVSRLLRCSRCCPPSSSVRRSPVLAAGLGTGRARRLHHALDLLRADPGAAGTPATPASPRRTSSGRWPPASSRSRWRTASPARWPSAAFEDEEGNE